MLNLHLISGYDPSKPNSDFAILTLYSNKKNFYVFGRQNNSLTLSFQGIFEFHFQSKLICQIELNTQVFLVNFIRIAHTVEAKL